MLPIKQSLYGGLARLNGYSTPYSLALIASYSTASGTTESSPSTTKPEYKRPKINPKLRDISFQIKSSVNSDADLTESIDIFEEGIQYLKEIQVSENIPVSKINYKFNPIVGDLFKKLLASDGATTTAVSDVKKASDFLDICCQYNLANRYHFTLVALAYVKSSDDHATTYRNILELWVKLIKYELNGNNSKFIPTGFDMDYRMFHLPNLAYFAYVNSCLLQETKFSSEDARKLLQTTELPQFFMVRKTLSDLKVFSEYTADFNKFAAACKENMYNDIDPNGFVVYKRIREASDRKDHFALNRLYQEVQDIASKKNQPISEQTLIRIMNGYFDCGETDQVFKIFQDMLESGVERPNIGTWDIVLRAMGSPANVLNKSESQKQKIANNLDRTVETIIQTGTELTAKTLSIVIGGFANLNKFDKVDEYINRFSGEGKLPIVFTTKNNILIGLLLNKNISGAESKLKEFMMDENYVPSTTVMNNFLDFYAKNKNYKAVEGILEFMKKHNIPEEVATYTIIINVFFRLHREKGLTPNVEQILQSITGSKSIQLNDFTYTTIIDGLVKDGLNVEAARSIYDSVSKKYKSSPNLHTTMMKGELEYGLVANGERIFDNYIKNIRNDTRIWNLMINGLLPKYDDLAFHYYENMKKQSNMKCEPNYFTYYFLLNHFQKRGNKDRVQHIIDDLANKKLNNLGSQIPKLLLQLSGDYNLSKNLELELAKVSK
jgi:pentatricopeptide repeat protein